MFSMIQIFPVSQVCVRTTVPYYFNIKLTLSIGQCDIYFMVQSLVMIYLETI